MKKIIIAIISAMILLPTMAAAQIKVEKKTKIETIKNIRMGYVSLNKNGDTYYMGMISDNHYDKPYVVILGEGIEAARESLNALVEISSTITREDTVEFNDGINNYSIYRGSFKSEVWIKGIGYAGYGKTSTAELKMLLKALEK